MDAKEITIKVRRCECGNEIEGSYEGTCEDCWALAQPSSISRYLGWSADMILAETANAALDAMAVGMA